MYDPQEMTDFLDGVVGAVEANSYEKYMLWYENQQSKYRKTWVSNNMGLMEIVGYIDKRPVCISLFTSVVGSRKILFYYATSQIVDHLMIDEWLKENLPKTAFRNDGYVNKTDATNFHILFSN